MPTRILARGLIAGVIAYLTVVVLYALFNLLTGRPIFYTAAQLGALLAGGAPDPTGAVLPGPVIAYNGVHLGVMILLGLVSSWLVHEWELHPQLWYAVFFVLTAGAVALTLLVGIYAAEFAGALSWRSVVVANVLAAGAMAGYLVFSSALKTDDD